jgi:hypothetical protein
MFGNTISETIQYDEVGGATSKPVVRTEYYDEASASWKELEDVESRTIEISNENKRYGSYSFLPPSKTVELMLNNFGQVYSTGSGDMKASILKNNMLIRCWSGYELAASGRNSYTDDFTTGVKFIHAVKSGSAVVPSISVTGTVSKYSDIVTMDAVEYGSRKYDAAGYYYKHHALPNTAYDSIEKLQITAATNKCDVRFRVGKLGWSPIYPMATGANEININSAGGVRTFEYMVRFRNTNWGTADRISNVKIHTRRKAYLFNRGTFVADEPEYAEKVKIRGRDYLKKALETEINLPAMTAVNIGTAVSYVLDRCGIPYSGSSWDSSSASITVNGTLAESLNNISGWKALGHMMDALNAGDDDWRIRWDDDGELMLKKIPTDVEADWTAHYFLNIEDVQKNFSSDKQLQRVTVMNKDVVVEPETLLKTLSGTSSAALSATYPPSVYVRYTDPNSVLLTESARSNTGVHFTATPGMPFTVRVYGCRPKNAITVEKWAERGHARNIIRNDGQTHKIINPVVSQDQALALAGYIIGQYGEPAKAVSLSLRSNPYLELNDNVLVFDRFTNTDDIFILNSIKETWNDPGLVDSLELKDRGFDLGAFTWDRHGWDTGANDIKWDTGFVFDQDLDIGGSDPTEY